MGKISALGLVTPTDLTYREKRASVEGMSGSTTSMTSDSGAYGSAFWERLWRTGGIQFIALCIIAYFIYGDQPQVGASSDALAAFYHGHHTRILIAAVVSGLAVLYLMWFAAAIRVTLADAGKDGWGAAATASSAAVGALFLLLTRGERRPRVFDRRAWNANALIRIERFGVGRLRDEFLRQGNADHVCSVRFLARRSDLERTLRRRAHRRRARRSWRHDVGRRTDSGHRTVPTRA